MDPSNISTRISFATTQLNTHTQSKVCLISHWVYRLWMEFLRRDCDFDWSIIIWARHLGDAITTSEKSLWSPTNTNSFDTIRSWHVCHTCSRISQITVIPSCPLLPNETYFQLGYWCCWLFYSHHFTPGCTVCASGLHGTIISQSDFINPLHSSSCSHVTLNWLPPRPISLSHLAVLLPAPSSGEQHCNVFIFLLFVFFRPFVPYQLVLRW